MAQRDSKVESIIDPIETWSALKPERRSVASAEFKPGPGDLPPTPPLKPVYLNDIRPDSPIKDPEAPLPEDWEARNARMALDAGLRPPKNKWMKRIMLFTPAFFAINMGTGILSLLLRQTDALIVPAVAFFLINVVLFTLFLGLTVTRFILWPKIMSISYRHPAQAFFYGTFSMGFATIVNFIVSTFGAGATIFSWGLWFIDALISLITNLAILFSLFTFQTQSLDTMTAAWLLPAVTTVVSSASGATVAQFLAPDQARVTLVLSYLLLGTGLPLAFLLMAIYASRLAFHKQPPPAAISSTFLPMGPCGQGAFAIVSLGQVFRMLVQKSGDFFGNGGLYSRQEGEMMASAVFAASIPLALVIWGLGLFWMAMAVGAVGQAFKQGMAFNLSWFGFTFPLGTMALAAFKFGEVMGSTFFNVIGAILTSGLFLIWAYAFFRSVQGTFTGNLFADPSLGEIGKSL